LGTRPITFHKQVPHSSGAADPDHVGAQDARAFQLSPALTVEGSLFENVVMLGARQRDVQVPYSIFHAAPFSRTPLPRVCVCVCVRACVRVYRSHTPSRAARKQAALRMAGFAGLHEGSEIALKACKLASYPADPAVESLEDFCFPTQVLCVCVCARARVYDSSTHPFNTGDFQY